MSLVFLLVSFPALHGRVPWKQDISVILKYFDLRVGGKQVVVSSDPPLPSLNRVPLKISDVS